jgi:hypothetical protein
MKIVMRDQRVFDGSDPLEIVRQMQELAFEAVDKPLPDYIAWVVENARNFDGVNLEVRGGTDDELAAALVNEMLRNDLAREVHG